MRFRTRHSAVAAALIGLVCSLLFATPAANAATTAATPGSFSGYAFDACHTPSQSAMDTWLQRSPYWGVGVYISGVNRACKNEPNLTAQWMTTQLKHGWKVLPLTVGLQPSCWRYGSSSAPRISTASASDYANARAQGFAEADSAASAAGGLAIPKKSTLWLDVEGFSNPNPNNYPKTAPLIPDPSWTATIPNPTPQPQVPNPQPQPTIEDPANPGSYIPDPSWTPTIPDPNWQPTISNPVQPQPLIPDPKAKTYTGPTNSACLASVVRFVSGWTQRLHQLGYKAGFYSSAASGVSALVDAVSAGIGPMPDHLWIAQWNNQATAASSYVPDSYWPAQRVHQYSGGHNESYGGVTLNIDSNWVEIGGGSKAAYKRKACGITLDAAPLRRTLHKGSVGADVKTLKCYLQLAGLWKGRITMKYDAKTVAAVKKLQKKAGIKPHGKATKVTRVALVARMSSGAPLLKIGARGASVRKVQRALNVAIGAKLNVNGVYDVATAKAVKKYQGKVKQPKSGVVASNTWTQLLRGKS